MKLNVILVDVYYVKKHKSKENLTSSKEDRAILRAYINSIYYSVSLYFTDINVQEKLAEKLESSIEKLMPGDLLY